MGKLQSKIRRRSDLYRATRGEAVESAPSSQVIQYDPAHTDAITCVTTLNSDLCVSGGSDQAVVVYDWRAGRKFRAFHGHNREVTKVKCIPGSSWILSASRDKTVLMWDLNCGAEPVQEFCGHELVVNGLAVSPDGSQLCTGSRDNSMCLWDIESGECLQRKTISRNLVTHVCWVPGAHSIVQTSEDKAIRVWDSRTWQVTNTFPAKQYIQTHCDVSSNSNYLLSSSNGFGGQGCEATLWDLRQPGCKVVEYRGHFQTTACCVFLPPLPGAQAMVATSSHDCSVKIWDQNTAACLCTMTLDGSGPLVSLAPCDVNSLLCASFNTGMHLLHLDHGAQVDLREMARF
ncbi:WD repeat-containing protein 31 [Arapaima gigas]